MRFGAHSKIDLIRHLLDNKADPLVADEDGWTPLWTAANEGVSIHPVLFSPLESEQADRMLTDALDKYAEVVRLLLTAGAAPSLETPCGKFGRTPLCTAAIGEHTDVIQVLVEFGADVNKEFEDGETVVCTPLTLVQMMDSTLCLHPERELFLTALADCLCRG